MYFERLVVDRLSGRVSEAVVAEPGLWRGGRLLVKALGGDDHAWIFEVLSRSLANDKAALAGERWRLEGAVLHDNVVYTLYVDDGEGQRLTGSTAELDEILSALSGLLEIT